MSVRWTRSVALVAMACIAAACGDDDDSVGQADVTPPATSVTALDPATTSPDTSAPPATSGPTPAPGPDESDGPCAGDTISAITPQVQVGDGSGLVDVLGTRELGCSTELAISGEAAVAYPAVGSCTITAPVEEAVGISRPSEQVLLELSRGRLVCTFDGDANLLYVCGTRSDQTAGTATHDCSSEVHEVSAGTAAVALLASDGERQVDPGNSVRLIPGSVATYCADCDGPIYVPSELKVTSTPSGAGVRVGMAVEDGEPVPGSGRDVGVTPITVELRESDVVPAPEPCCRVVVGVTLAQCGSAVLDVAVTDQLGVGLSYETHADLDCPTLADDELEQKTLPSPP